MFIVVLFALFSFGTTHATPQLKQEVAEALREVHALREQGVFADALAQAREYLAQLRWERRDRTPEMLLWYNESVSLSDWEIQLCKGDLAIAGLAGSYWSFEWLFYHQVIAIIQTAYLSHTETSSSWDKNYRAYRDRTVLPQLLLATLIYTLGSEGISLTGKKCVLDKWLASDPIEPRPFTHAFGAPMRRALMHIMSPQTIIDAINTFMDQFGMMPNWCKSWPFKFSKAFTTNLLFIIWLETQHFGKQWNNIVRTAHTHQLPIPSLTAPHTKDLFTTSLALPFDKWLAIKIPTTSMISATISATVMLPSYYTLYKKLKSKP